jgi:peptidoglycan/LPS O-acetylase OafA/YrhL
MTEHAAVSRRTSLVWLDALKGVAMLWIVLNHIVERIAGGEFVGNPGPEWPPLATRIAQFAAPVGSGIANAIVTLLRDIGWLGDQGVTLFLIASGFGIAYGLRARDVDRVALSAFYRARAKRIYPLWIGAHVVLLVVLCLTWGKAGPSYVLSLIGIRFLPQTMYAFVPAWWYFGLLVQLYAITPFLWIALRRFGTVRVLVASCAIGFVARALGLFALHAYLDEWSRGAIFVTRLPEYTFGMCLALWYAADPDGVSRALRRPLVLAAAAVTFVVGFVCAFTLAGMTIAPFAMGVGAFVVLAAFLGGSRAPGALAWTGRNSYALYLVHQPFVETFVPVAPAALGTIAAGVSAALVGTAVAGRLLEAFVDRFVRSLAAGLLPAVRLAAVSALAVYAVLLALDVAAAKLSPQEINGWGERPSLEPAADVGWKLIPSKTTRLRWESYDYVVHSNALGFPGDDVAIQKPPGTLRVLVTGDAFTSGEGVGTAGAWPTLLQADLAKRLGRNVQVLNFGITGYGPDQELRVLREYVPRYKPDVVVLESFVNAFEKLDLTDDEITKSIGFGRPPGNALSATLRLYHLRAVLQIVILGPLEEYLTGKPDQSDVGLSDGSAFLTADPDNAKEVAEYEARVGAARDVAYEAGASFLLVLIPSRAEECSATDYRRGALLSLDPPTYAADRPIDQEITAAVHHGLPFVDLRRPLATGACLYQRENMHFLEAGDVLTAGRVAAAIVANLKHPTTP